MAAASIPSIPNDVPLVLHVHCDGYTKHIRFRDNVDSLTQNDIHRKVAKSLHLGNVDFSLRWTDDDGEQVDIAHDDDVREALAYFMPSLPLERGQHISMRVEVAVDAGISLSDFEESDVNESGSTSENGVGTNGGDLAWKHYGHFLPGQDGAQLSDAASSEMSERIRSSALSPGDSSGEKVPETDSVDTSTSAWRTSTASSSKQSDEEDSDDDNTCRSSDYDQRRSKKLSLRRDAPPSWDVHRIALIQKWNDSCQGQFQSFNRKPPKGKTFSESSGSVQSWGRTDSSFVHDDESLSNSLLNMRYPDIGGPSDWQTRRADGDERLAHMTVECASCRVVPITGSRYHCVACPRPSDFCEGCERSGRAIRDVQMHNSSHMMIKIPKPLQGHAMANYTATVLQQTKMRLAQEARTFDISDTDDLANIAQGIKSRSMSAPTRHHPSIHLLCALCSSAIQGTRYLCANCPIITPASRDGFNICASCERNSLELHDPTHFFLKMSAASTFAVHNPQRMSREVLGDRWEIRETTGGGALLPPLYADVTTMEDSSSFSEGGNAVALIDNMDDLPSTTNNALVHRAEAEMTLPAQGTPPHRVRFNRLSVLRHDQATANDLSESTEGRIRRIESTPPRYIVLIDKLVHVAIMCDHCFQLIRGIWYCCCNCKPSFDLCSKCNDKVTHDPTHAFAVFKQPVDMALFKSLIDHQDAGDRVGPARPLLQFSLSGLQSREL